MYDTVSIVKGGVYELLDKFGKPYEFLYLVVSDNQYNAMTDFVMVCTISPRRDPSERDVYHVPFDMINKGIVSKMDILSETLFNVSKKRLTRYKFSLNDNIMKEVAKKLQMVIFGQELYTLNEAIVKLHYIELDKKLQYLGCETPTTSSSILTCEEDVRETSIDVSYGNMSIDDMQKAYAYNHKEAPIETNAVAQEHQEEPQLDSDDVEQSETNPIGEKEKRKKPIGKKKKKEKEEEYYQGEWE